MKLKTLFIWLCISILFNACSNNDDNNNQNNNPNIPNIPLDTGNQINTDLGGFFGQLKFINNPIKIPNYGINGIVVVKDGVNSYSAFEFSDPNHPITNCSNFQADSGITPVDIEVTCSCNDGNSYNILSGGIPTPGTIGQYTLVRYRVEVNGTIIRVFNK